jgi:uncharacterized protein (DUF2249 family)
MIKINVNTKIAALIKQHPDALETIISISSKFEKLRNPVLRKLMAGRASISMASKMSGCSIKTFYEKLKPLGFEIDGITTTVTEEKQAVPDFMSTLQKDQVVELDVRPVIASGKDPLNIITQKVKTIKAGQVLKIINSFEPIPLMKLLEKQGFEVFADAKNDDLVETYFYKKSDAPANSLEPKSSAANGWEQTVEKFTNKMQTIDVRQMEMPLPMITILETLDKLPEGNALFVYHKRIPVFLLPELAERKFDYRIKEKSEGEVQLLIFKD